MALTQGDFGEYDFNRRVIRFTMKNEQVTVAGAASTVPCAVSTEAMDQLEGTSGLQPHQREQQFLRLRQTIEDRASQKFSEAHLEGNPPGVILRTIDFR